ncbi:IS200/IS605 family transposase [Spirosoma sp. HMF3257]|uniref:IS200/IS605 family transposase n=1 Tax=Spirosoma telluris TaxID=2183553 RepID=A0A327NMA7_9BACT|nr:IS200/IS605 family transposase [Spirosoma telluris]RAI73738.1 IS200/IS605 family transposase [Spirosoma telluris]
MSVVRIWLHIVWSTKNREPFFETAVQRKLVFEHIRAYGHSKDINVDFVNGHIDHVHVLLALRATETVADVVKLLKGESSHWLKQQGIVPAYFAWQSDYFAVSVSESVVNRVRDYMKNQETHHLAKSFAEEYDDFVNRINKA